MSIPAHLVSARCTISEARLRLLAARLHALGPRPLYEYLKELNNGADLLERLERFAELDAKWISSIGGDKMPPPARLISYNRDADGPDGRP